ncbi:MAG: NADH-quinone oxidoreductase subunit F [Gammaproteobacteria bacterium SG8_31]|jgi:NADH:ubiquinone oxidoreductase subunit F (NADH-binding)/NADH:ubiquinone oxidoreductase subunit E|nr:MAG: NADH-quinone oxidoreductase subunit F [Gammaproteobacteria bacterium SG8_31]
MSPSEAEIVRLRHPGKGKHTTRPVPKGRQVDPVAVDEVRGLLGPEPVRRDLLIEYLHAVQDAFGHLSTRHLAALAELMKLAQTEVFETATFYAHFDVIPEGQEPPPDITVRVCDGLSCELAGAESLMEGLRHVLGSGARVLRAPCMGRCHCGPTVAVGARHLDHATVDLVADAVSEKRMKPVIPDYVHLENYLADGGYGVLKQCLDGRRSVESVIAILTDSGLRGLGGAGFPPGRKWEIVRSYDGPRALAVNADEGEPGTFKDRFHLENSPHNVLEGMLIAAWAVEAETAYLYVRDEYPAARAILRKEIDALTGTGLADHVRIELRRGAGAYICGEESAMIESIEGKRGLPRHRPPYVAEVGIFGRPTLVNNVETLYWIRDILEKGATWFADHGVKDARGLRSYSVSGRVRDPGIKLAPAGITARELIENHCGGMAPGHEFKAYLPGGASGGILPASMADLPLDFGSLEPYGSFVGSHAVIVLGHRDDLRRVALNLMRFFEDESCGQCTPCRVGTEKAVALMRRPEWDAELLRELADTMTDASICGLGQAAGNPLMSLLRYFPETLR